jgi:hypothetical protein
MAGALGEEVHSVSDRCAAQVEALRIETAGALDGKADKASGVACELIGVAMF